jgi:class 3 adenylate cyclase/tetratricopeptide (TPR) repeat protein
MICAKCGTENVAEAKFCRECATPFAAPPRDGEKRKTVTVLFSDVTGSTALGERVDPESLRRVMARYFEAMSQAIERHGGTVEKFIGDAVMAVFGVPVLHEDDALRAVRAATEMRAALGPLNEELERDYGTTLALRMGVNTGEVVTGTEERLATGDAVNVAARLEQAAGPGEILIGAATLAVVRDAVEVEPVPPLDLKGKTAPVAAYRLVGVEAGVPGRLRRQDARMVGRAREMRRLRDSFGQARADSACQLFTVLGAAGVGKSRLVREFLDATEGALVVQGRCLSYGEGITYWPVVEVAKQILGEDPDGRLVELALDTVALGTLAALLDGTGAPTSSEEIAWAIRKLFEAAAAKQPLVVVFDDIHWAEPTFLDLVDHVAGLSRDAPILLLCMARTELHDLRPAWGGGMPNSTTVLLEPLSTDETDELIEDLLRDAELDEPVRLRIRDSAEGNPLFVEEMLALLRENGSGDVTVPPTIHALLAARLDQLDPSERAVLERGSIEGKVFHRGAAQALAPDEPDITSRLSALVRKELVRPERVGLLGEDAYRFRHLLIRDAAYEGLPKTVRAELHERFASWLDERARDLVEQDEIVGYHLEQAHRYRKELGPVDEAGQVLARRAAQRLAAGARTAAAREDVRAAAGLFGRAVELLPDGDRARLEILPDLAEALIETGDFARAAPLLDESLAGAREAGDERLRARASLRQIGLTSTTVTSFSAEEALPRIEAIAASLEPLGDDAGLAEALALLGRMRFFLGRAAGAEAAYAPALEHARRAGDQRRAQDCLSWWLAAKCFGPAPVAEGVAFIDAMPDDALRAAALASFTHTMRGIFEAMEGRFDAGRELVSRGTQIADDFGLRVRGAMQSLFMGQIELLAGDPAAAEHAMRGGYDALGALGETGFRSTVGSVLALAICEQGKDEEAERLLDEVDAIMQPTDFDPQARTRAVRAKLLARRGELTQAERLAREAVALGEPTDYLALHAESVVVLAEVLRLSGRTGEAADAAREAHALYARKGDLVSAERTRSLLAELVA